METKANLWAGGTTQVQQHRATKLQLLDNIGDIGDVGNIGDGVNDQLQIS
jgi:hypothetical protein